MQNLKKLRSPACNAFFRQPCIDSCVMIIYLQYPFRYRIIKEVEERTKDDEKNTS